MCALPGTLGCCSSTRTGGAAGGPTEPLHGSACPWHGLAQIADKQRTL